LKPIYEQIRTGVMAGGYVQVDETPIDYLEPGHGKTRQGYLWTSSCPRGDVFYRWETSRSADCLENIIAVDFKGIIQCDGYAAYRAFANRRGSAIGLAGCWAHVRRKFHEALEQSPRTSGWIVRQIQHLYRIEARLREGQAGPRLRAAVRAHQSRPIVERIRRALVRLKSTGRYLPQSLLGQAIDYTLGQWSTLEVYLGDGRVEIGRVRMWRGEFRRGLSVVRLFRSVVPHEPCRASVSTSCSSNRTCSFTAFGSRLRLQAFAFDRSA
jgi:transposase